MTTPLFLLRCVQLGISIHELELLSIGMINDMYAESRNDECKYAQLATQQDFDRFLLQVLFSLIGRLFPAILVGNSWLGHRKTGS